MLLWVVKGHGETRVQTRMNTGFVSAYFCPKWAIRRCRSATRGSQPAWLLGFLVFWRFSSFSLVLGLRFLVSFAFSSLGFSWFKLNKINLCICTLTCT